jgi:ubiquitin C-terminal hydrolase
VSIYECFEYFQKAENMTGDNQIFCNNCHSYANSMNTTKLIICPKILVINLNRGKGLQYDIKLDFDDYINLKNFVFYAQSPSFYELIGIVTHFGSSDMSGHFIAFCKSFHDRKWYRYNDSIVTMSSFEEAKITGVPYILFYSYIKV